ncbi:SLAM family member 6 isoform X5 [Piliocolobus tephrosceles]|uniref:SLAM family member 6 isoform X5 n=1 Tax=Piliocolobus tephrosceles TaxID=591936 RepID=UPI000C2AB74E|nr:SLAM family member 6 isoform X5 [Piliocolobus tephrosceles]
MTEKQNVDCLKVSSTSLHHGKHVVAVPIAPVCLLLWPSPLHRMPAQPFRCPAYSKNINIHAKVAGPGCSQSISVDSQQGREKDLHVPSGPHHNTLALKQLCSCTKWNLVSQSRSTPLMVNGVLGESVILPLKFPAGEKIQSITWLFNGTSLAFIVLSETNSTKIHVTHPKQRKRLNFTQSYSLKLSNLEMEDTGSYSAQITTETSANLSSYTLRIFRQLRNIQVNNYSQLFQNRTCEIHLTCSVEDADDNVSFRWEALGSTLSSEPNITTSWDPRISSEQDYTCIAENAVSNLSFSVSAQKLCGDAKIQYIDTKMILFVVFGTCIVTSFIIVLLLVLRKRRDSLPLSTQRTQGPAESAGNIEYVSVSPVSNTVYASVTHSKRETEISTPIKNATVTIYSTINHSKESKPTFSRATALDNVM